MLSVASDLLPASGMLRRPRFALRVAFAAVIGLASLSLSPRPAAACSCAEASSVMPADGAVDVPRDAAIVLTSETEPTSPILRLAGSAAAIALEPIAVGDTAVAMRRPVALLAAGATYEVVVDQGAGPAVVSTFTVGEHTVGDALAAPRLVSVAARRFRATPDGCQSSCFGRPDGDDVVEIGHDGGDAGALGRLVRVRDLATGDVFERFIIAPDGDTGVLRLASAACDTGAPQLADGASYCAQVVSYDAAGNTGASDELCAAAATCVLDACSGDGWGEVAACGVAEADSFPAPDSGEADSELADVGRAGCAVGSGGGPTALALLALAGLLARRRRARSPRS